MTQTKARFISVVFLAIFLVGCDMPAGKNATAKPESTLSEQQNKLAALPDHAPEEGMCAGWQQSLAKGRKQHQVAYCLRSKALKDRSAAVQEATELMGWDIKSTDDSDLKPLITALAKYPEPGALEARLRDLSLLPNKPGEYSNLNNALTAADYLSELGNIYWFDAETGMFPNEHDVLLSAISELSDLGDVTFTEVPPSSWESDNEPYRINATIDGSSYSQVAENYGDWYDIGAVLTLLNRIALEQGRKSRFVSLPTGDQTAIVWVVEYKKLMQLIDEGLIQMSAAELSMQTGKAAEEAMKKELL